MSDEESLRTQKDIRRELSTIRELIGKVIYYITDAESEIPEKMRRFIMYMHDVHDIVHLYHENGQEAPSWVKREMERCDDRYRQLLKELHLEGNTFAKVRAEMAKDEENKWDHTRLLTKGNQDETRNG